MLLGLEKNVKERKGGKEEDSGKEWIKLKQTEQISKLWSFFILHIQVVWKRLISHFPFSYF